jgi:transposase-like protein
MEKPTILKLWLPQKTGHSVKLITDNKFNGVILMKTRKKYNKQFKIDAVNLLNSSDKTVSEVARNLGIRQDLLSRWKREMEDEYKKPFTGHGNPRDEEIARLKKENAELKMERDILKKAMAIFSAPER